MLEINSKVVDVSELERKIETKIIEKNIPSEIQLEDVSSLLLKELVILRQNYSELNNKWKIHEVEISSHRPVIGRCIVFSKKVIRKLTRWLFSTYYNQQSEFNSATVRTIGDMIRIQHLLIEKLSEEEKNNAN